MINTNRPPRSWTLYSYEQRGDEWVIEATTWTPDGPIETSRAVVDRIRGTAADAETRAQQMQSSYDAVRSAAISG